MPWASSRILFGDWSYNETFEVSTPVCELLVLVPPTVAPKVSSTTTGDEKLDKSSVAMAVAVAASGQCRDR